MSKLKIISQLLTAAILLVSCGGSDAPRLPTGDNKNKTINLTKDTPTTTLETKIKYSLYAEYGKIREVEYYLASVETAQAPSTYTSTNVQESGVDELDRLKTDGEYLYASMVNDAGIKIFQANTANAPLVSLLKINTLDETLLSGLYLLKETKKLIAVASRDHQQAHMWGNWLDPHFWSNRKTEIFTVDISVPSAPQKQVKLTLDGQLITSRRIADTLYVATRHTPFVDGLESHPQTESAVQRNKQLIDEALFKNFLPQYQINDEAGQALFAEHDCFATDDPSSSYEQISIISLLAIDLSNVTAKPTGQCFVGDTETLYASTQAIYLATTQYDHSSDDSGLGDDPKTSTQIHKFTLADGSLDYRSTGSVDGHLGWQQDLKPFRMSEHDDVLRVITYVGQEPDAYSSPARLYTLAENTDTQRLDVLAKLPNAKRPAPLGKVGEEIYATRFIGDRGYLVTFKITDPLYVLELSDPSDPYIASALEIDGYSDYLHPVGANYLLGIGKSATLEDTTNTDNVGDGRGAWYQGVKLSLIDISDPTAPFEKQTIDIGQRGTETAASKTHHALSSLQNGDTLEVTIPVSVHDTVNEEYLPYVAEPWFSYQWTRNELQHLSINTNSGEITTRPALVNTKAETDLYYNWAWSYDRSAIIGDSLYYLNEDTMTAR
ncbi:hypothetical protein EOL70_12695 [Leucothrix sargassi]|nr:hypothetical protein EOL70_12695 [Leucothrix sargassi]